MSVPAEIATALAQFPGQEFRVRDIARRFSNVRPEHVQHALKALTERGQVKRAMHYGIFYYRAAA